MSEAIARKFRQGDKERKALLQVFQKVGEDHDTRLQLDMCSKFVLRNRAFLFFGDFDLGTVQALRGTNDHHGEDTQVD